MIRVIRTPFKSRIQITWGDRFYVHCWPFYVFWSWFLLLYLHMIALNEYTWVLESIAKDGTKSQSTVWKLRWCAQGVRQNDAIEKRRYFFVHKACLGFSKCSGILSKVTAKRTDKNCIFNWFYKAKRCFSWSDPYVKWSRWNEIKIWLSTKGVICIRMWVLCNEGIYTQVRFTWRWLDAHVNLEEFTRGK